jgi:hypothetical protein
LKSTTVIFARQKQAAETAQCQKDGPSKLEPIFTVLPIAPRIADFTESLARTISVGIGMDASFHSDAMRSYSEIQSTAPSVARSLQSVNRGRSSGRSKLNSGN